MSASSPPPAWSLGRAVLLDLCAWLGDWPGPVPRDVPYALETIREVQGGRSRLARYLPPELFRRWDATLGQVMAGGGTVDLRLDAMSFQPAGADGGRIEFTDITGGASRRWRLELRIDPARNAVLDAWFTRVDA